MMEPETSLSLAFLLTLLLLNLTVAVLSADKYSRGDFPVEFVFGSGTTAYQVEGAAKEDGRTPSIWDTFVHAGYMHGENGDVACDGYHKYKEDVRLMVETGLEAYRFSISWSRLIPRIQQHVTLHNFDLPQALEDEYGGWDKQHGFVGISVYTFGYRPHTDTEKDRIASQRAREFGVGWIMEPLVRGDYPISMKTNAGGRIPAFTNHESKQVKGAYDFIGVIHYSVINVTDNSDALKRKLRDYATDMAVQLVSGQGLDSNEEYPITPWGLVEELEGEECAMETIEYAISIINENKEYP